MPFLLKRVAWGVFVLWAVATLVFFGIHATGDPISDGLRETGASEAQIIETMAALGLDRPMVEQYGSFLMDTLRGDFGNSFRYGTSAAALIFDRLPYTLTLALAAMILTVVIAIPLGLLAAMKPSGIADRIASAVGGVGQSVPNFVIGPVLILVFAVSLPILPISGAGGPLAIVLPAITLSLYPIARVTRMMRSSASRIISMDYVDNARAKGISEKAVLWRHILRNALLSVVTLLGLELTNLVGGAVIVESIFAWPGIGSLVREAFAFSDFPVGQALVILIAAMVVVVNLLTDVTYSIIDPRIAVE